MTTPSVPVLRARHPTRSPNTREEAVMADRKLLKLHQEAGRRYAAACTELRAAMVDLAAIESALPPHPLQTFEATVPDALPDLKHREFVPSPPQGIRAAVAGRRLQLVTAA